jgi:hypothetical protein
MATILSLPAITTALTAKVGPTLTIHDQMSPESAVIQAVVTYGSGGTTYSFYVQTSLDFGNSWIDVWNFSGTTAGLAKVINISSATPITTSYTPTGKAISANTSHDGILGPLWRVAYDTTGTYAGTSVTVDIYFPGVQDARVAA